MSHLSKLGITEKLDVNNNGTLYQINLSGKIVDMVKKRFKPKTSLAVKEDTPPTQEEGVDLSLEIEQVEQKLSEIKSKQRALSDGLPENFSPIQMLKGDVEFDMASLERLSQLSDIEDKLESKLSELKQEQSTFESSPQSPPDPIKRKSSPRYVRPCDAKALNTRIGKLSFVRSKEQRQVLFAEALWALRFGWYCGYEGSTFQCVNHILKLLKNNDWRTPSQFKPQQVEKLIQYFDIG
jgi:chaperonin cofactor prefoldin